VNDVTLDITIRLDAGADLQTMRRAFDRALIANMLARNGGMKQRTADALGITREGLWKLTKRLEL